MYSPEEAKKSYSQLLKDNGLEAAIKSAIFIGSWMMFNAVVVEQQAGPVAYGFTYVFFCAYLTWKHKFTRFLRGVLRGKGYRDKAD